MLSAYLNEYVSWGPILSHRILGKSLVWLNENASNAPIGDYPLDEGGWYVNVHTYTTRLERVCVWESHSRTVDVQYIIKGEEAIRWLSTSKMSRVKRELTDQDRTEWEAPDEASTTVVMREGMFAIFLPGEAHCPMVALDTPIQIRKAVVKVPVQLLSH